ncbi:tyrosine--tRNA ligase [Candidatus Saccharibacteria bacterium]|nr:tyrosine--tRNA ligase [Candidatus Saccharibacteria bacterium]
MKLSEELIYRGFNALTTIEDPASLDTRNSKKFYFGADPSADSLTIGNLAALMMCACFARHGYEPYLLVGGATGQIGDPKENGERDLKSISEIEHNKKCIKEQIEKVIVSARDAQVSTVCSAEHKDLARAARSVSEGHAVPTCASFTVLDNLDWFKDIKYLDFLREIGKVFSMTQLLDRQFVEKRIGAGGSGISYAEFSYTLIQGYDYLHLYRKYGIDLQLCGADQYGNCTSGIHLIKRLEDANADVWSTPLVIDPVTGRKFGKSEGNAIWLASEDNGSGNYTSIFDFYQFWLNQPDSSVEYLIKIYTTLEKSEIEDILAHHREHPEERLAQKALAHGATEVVHGHDATIAIENLTQILFDRTTDFSSFSTDEISSFASYLPTAPKGTPLVDILTMTSLASSKKKAREFISGGAISINGTKVTDDISIDQIAIVKKGKNKFAVVK